jgi:transcriptional regulator with XRE-family HTH domain
MPPSGLPISGRATVSDMASKRERTLFGERLHAARTHAKLSQPQLARAVGMAQSTIGELEYIGTGSSKTAQIAQACGVNPQWLAEGVGPMFEGPSSLSPELLDLALKVEAMPTRQRDWLMMTLREAVKIAHEMVTENVVTPAPVPRQQNIPSSSTRRRAA